MTPSTNRLDWLFVGCQAGHIWESIGGCNAGCDDACGCSVPVHKCSRCGECDYGLNPEAFQMSPCAKRGTSHDHKQGNVMRVTIEGSADQIRQTAKVLAKPFKTRPRANEGAIARRNREIQTNRKFVHRAWTLVRREDSARAKKLLRALTQKPNYTKEIIELAASVITEKAKP